ncbi:MAG: hypothetical protein IJ137_08625 [Eubacterium sp.]|nr:hypothetical protein [Eubacterium sp.]
MSRSKMNTAGEKRKPGSGRSYIIGLSKWRSLLALFASLITVSFSMYGVAGGMVIYVENQWPLENLFHFLTINVSCLMAFCACLIIPFAVEGMRKKHFSYPKWVAMLHYSGITCSTFVFVFTVGLMSWADPYAAFGGYNRYLHIVCPIMTLIAFFMVESGFVYTLKDAVIAIIPTLIYEIIYLYEVVILGADKGGWEDMYHVTEYLPSAVSAVLVLLLVTGVSLLIRFLYNKLTIFRLKKMRERLWPEDVDPTEIMIEIFGLGRYMGKHVDSKYADLPLDVIQMIADMYGFKMKDLMKPYMKGFQDSLEEK